VFDWQVVAIMAISFLLKSKSSAHSAQTRAFDEKAAGEFYRGRPLLNPTLLSTIVPEPPV
jgi:hypothetical protein